eukprot:TRINITY_DN13517_c0_g1_i1.p2 TRINITY_DN13517_c0_g1~~TRINITY_DN13517_c0_g1_i1.p2  ORF type:complete len:278 (+),score=85.13 TRINITY_DN13517_c0_g1_i1:777-1610(+)
MIRRQKNTQLEEALKQRRVERASLELLYMEYEASRKELTKSNAQVRRVQRECDRWKTRAVKMNYDSGVAGFEQAEEMAKRQEKVDEQLRKERARRERRQKLREKRLNAATNGDNNGATTDPSSSDYDYAGSDKEDTANRVNPMEILAMWNINFDAWQEENIPPREKFDNNTIQYTHYEGDAEAVEGDPQEEYHPAPPKKNKTVPETTSQSRLKADRGLSVLSKTKTKQLHPRYTKPKGREVSSSFSESLTVINSEGEFSVRNKKQDGKSGGNRFFVP